MPLRLNGSTSGSVTLEAPADTSPTGTDITLTLPTTDGDNGQYLQTNGSGTLSWQTVPNNGFESYAVIADQKASGTGGGTFTNGAWRTRDLNTEISDADGIVSISSNQFTLGAGNYLIRWQCPALRIERHISRLQDITNTATVGTGSSSYTDASTSLANSVSFGAARVSITGDTVYEVQNICFTSRADFGFGLAVSLDSTTETYTIVEIFKEA